MRYRFRAVGDTADSDLAGHLRLPLLLPYFGLLTFGLPSTCRRMRSSWRPAAIIPAGTGVGLGGELC